MNAAAQTEVTTTDWYERRSELTAGQVFRCQGGFVKLDGRAPGDGTQWLVADWHDGWAYYESVIEPGDLEGEPIPDIRTALVTTAA